MPRLWGSYLIRARFACATPHDSLEGCGRGSGQADPNVRPAFEPIVAAVLCDAGGVECVRTEQKEDSIGKVLRVGWWDVRSAGARVDCARSVCKGRRV